MQNIAIPDPLCKSTASDAIRLAIILKMSKQSIEITESGPSPLHPSHALSHSLRKKRQKFNEKVSTLKKGIQ